MKRFHLATLLGVTWVVSFVLAASLRSPVFLALGVLAFMCTPVLVMALYLRDPIRPPKRRVGGLKASLESPKFPRLRTWG